MGLGKLACVLRGYFEGDGSVSLSDRRVSCDSVSEGLLSDLENESTNNFLNRNFTIQSLPTPLSFHGTLTISQPQFQQSTILFTLQNKEGNEVKFDVENVSSSYSLKLPADASNNLAVLATENYVDQKVIKLINGAPATLDT